MSTQSRRPNEASMTMGHEGIHKMPLDDPPNRHFPHFVLGDVYVVPGFERRCDSSRSVCPLCGGQQLQPVLPVVKLMLLADM
jgi:hypothetical protein